MKASLLAVAISALLLSACGGGGGGDKNDATPSGAVVSTSSFPVSAVASASEQTNDSYTVTAPDIGGKPYTLTVTNAPGPQTTFEQKTASSSVQSVVLRQNGTLVNQSVDTSYFQLTPYLNYGEIDQSSGEYTVSNVTTPLYLPATAKVGESGALNSAVTYSNANKLVVVSKQTKTWSLEADTATTAYLCANLVSTPTSGSTTTQSSCYRITTSGVVTGHKLTITVNGQTAVFQ
jgi:hypothetical protein